MADRVIGRLADRPDLPTLLKSQIPVKQNLTNIFYVKREYPLDINTHLDFKVASAIMSV